MSEQLFRKEAIQAQQPQWLGEIVLIRPLSFSLMCLLALVLAAVVVGFFLFGSYTKRSTVSGQLLPVGGLIKVQTPQTGIVIEKLVSEGQAVTQGQALLRLSSERFAGSADPLQATIAVHLQERANSLRVELEKTRQLHEEELHSLTSKVASLSRELVIIDQQSSSQRSLVALADDASQRYRGLLDKGYIATDQFQQRQAELLGQRQTLHSLERERSTMQQQLQERQNDLAALPNRQANQLALIERQLNSIAQEQAQTEAQRSLLITAPASGVASAVLAEVGQSVDSSRTLLSILPAQSQLQAQLYAPSRAVGFVQPGDQVLLRYQAYPYQKFGQYRGQVESISRSALSPEELRSMLGQVPQLAGDGEALYSLKVRLEQQSVRAYGRALPLHSGMLLEADILQERRRLYEWVLEPLYSLTGKL